MVMVVLDNIMMSTECLRYCVRFKNVSSLDTPNFDRVDEVATLPNTVATKEYRDTVSSVEWYYETEFHVSEWNKPPRPSRAKLT